MNRVGTLFICIVCGVALGITARADTTPYANINASAFRGNAKNTNLLNRIMMMKKHHQMDLNLPPGFPQMNGLDASQPNAPQAKVPSARIPKSSKFGTPADVRPKLAAPAAPSDAGAPSGNPYASIVTRNVFGLNPIPPPDPVKQPDGPPPPKITLTGIMTIFGPPEALFKVAGVVRDKGQPHDESYIFTEGEMQDDVLVKTIDTNKMVVSFMNHGVQQDIGLIEGTASSGSAPSAPSWPGQPRMRKFGRFGAYGGTPGGFQTQSYGNPNGGAYNNNNNSQNGNNPLGGFNNNYQSGNYHNNTYVSPAISQLSDEDQQALVAAAHAQAVQNNDPTAVIFPPTSFDNAAAAEAGGNTGNSPNPAGSNPYRR